MGLAEEPIGKPLEQYPREYKEIKLLGEGGQSTVILVRRIKDENLFAAKKQLKSSGVEFAKKEYEMLEKLKNPNIVECIESFHTPGED